MSNNKEIEIQTPIKSYLNNYTFNKQILFIGRETNNWKLAKSDDIEINNKMARYLLDWSINLSENDAESFKLFWNPNAEICDHYVLGKENKKKSNVQIRGVGDVV